MIGENTGIQTLPQTSHISLLTLAVLLLACSPTRRLADDQYLLDKNVLTTEGIDLSKEELNSILKQRPNKRILPFTRFHLHMYNLPDPNKMDEKRAKKDIRRAKKNEKRKRKGKEPVGPGRTIGEWFREVVGEPPAILDTALVSKGREQLSTYLVKKGYFINSVADSVALNEDKQRATVFYHLSAKEPFIVDSVHYQFDDPGLMMYLDYKGSSVNLKSGDRFDVEKLGEERNRMTNLLRNNGFYAFSRDFIRFEVDTTAGGRMVDVIYHLENQKKTIEAEKDSVINLPHRRYSIGKVSYEYNLDNQTVSRDTTEIDGYHFINSSQFPLRGKVLIQNTFLYPGSLYEQDRVQLTYRRLSALAVISHVKFQFDLREDEQIIDINILVSPAKRQNFSFETKGTNSGGFLGLEGDLVYRHKNIFKGAEIMELKLAGGFQAQALLTDDTGSDPDVANPDNVNLNTRELGPSLSLTFPKFLIPIRSEVLPRSINPSTEINTGYSFQSRPDYKRQLGNIFIGYAWNETPRKRHQINPLEVSIIDIEKSEEFQNRLDQLGDDFLSDSYQDHFITATTYSFTINDRDRSFRKNSLYYRGDVEFSGSLLRSLFKLTGASQDENGSYTINDIRFSHYIKTNSDFRYYRSFGERSSLAYRLAGGVGVPLTNLNVLPFSKSFFGGGANGLRAWRARTIGPGGYFEPQVTFDKIGDVQLETNLEYRFNLIDYLDGAFFVDAGNIWLLEENDLRPNGHFQFDRFWSEIAVGAGIGLRLDFDYFLVRFDLASQLKDPSLVQGERWIYQPKDEFNEAIDTFNSSLGPDQQTIAHYSPRFNFNLGIGYPF